MLSCECKRDSKIVSTASGLGRCALSVLSFFRLFAALVQCSTTSRLKSTWARARARRSQRCSQMRGRLERLCFCGLPQFSRTEHSRSSSDPGDLRMGVGLGLEFPGTGEVPILVNSQPTQRVSSIISLTCCASSGLPMEKR